MTEGSRQRIAKEALTFDDVLLIPRHSVVHPKDTDVSSRVTREIELRIPLLSAAMDTVTESRMAIQMAREGGMGIIHKNLTPEKQAEEVDRVKRSESGMILNPITLTSEASLRDAHALMSRFSISGVPIVEEDGELVGIVTNRDLQFETELDKPISVVMTSENLVTVPVGTTLDQAEKILHEHRIEKLPVVDDDGRLKGLITVKDIFKRRTRRVQGRARPAPRWGGGWRVPGGHGPEPSSRPAWTCWWSTRPTGTPRASWKPSGGCERASPTSSS